MLTKLRFVVIVLMLGLSAPSLQVFAQEDLGTWRGRWWNYYERGLERGEAGDWGGAKTDFSKAIELREKDVRRARTYGMHFIDYFPHRELGIACYRSGELDRALRELEISYASAESAKAAFYLNAVRRELLRQKGASLLKPEISIVAPKAGQFYRDATITVSGVVSAAARVASLQINGVPYRFDVARDHMEFSSEVAVDDDGMVITVEAADLIGNSTRTEIPIKIDREGPSLSLTAISRMPDAPGSIHIRADLADAVGIKSVLVNGTRIPTGDAKEMVLDTVTVLPNGSSAIRIEAQDLLGNVTTIDLDPDRDHAEVFKSAPRTLLAFNALRIFSGDREPPVITLKDTNDLSAVYIDRYYVEGEVFDSSKIDRITVNGREIQCAKGKKVFFSKMVGLKEGKNRISVEAYDSAGNVRVAGFNVNHIVPSARLLSARMSVSVLPFDSNANKASFDTMAEDFLVASLVDQKRFQIVERAKLHHILREQKLAKEKLTDQEHTIQIGKLLSADAVLVTSMIEAPKSIEVTSRLVSSETAEVMETKDGYVEDKSVQSVKGMMDGLACKLTRAFPVVEGVVVKREKASVFCDLGESSGIRRPMGAAFYRRGKEIRHPVTGKSLGWEMVKIADGTIEEVQHDFSRIRLHKHGKQQDIKIKDTIITR